MLRSPILTCTSALGDTTEGSKEFIVLSPALRRIPGVDISQITMTELGKVSGLQAACLSEDGKGFYAVYTEETGDTYVRLVGFPSALVHVNSVLRNFTGYVHVTNVGARALLLETDEGMLVLDTTGTFTVVPHDLQCAHFVTDSGGRTVLAVLGSNVYSISPDHGQTHSKPLYRIVGGLGEPIVTASCTGLVYFSEDGQSATVLNKFCDRECIQHVYHFGTEVDCYNADLDGSLLTVTDWSTIYVFVSEMNYPLHQMSASSSIHSFNSQLCVLEDSSVRLMSGGSFEGTNLRISFQNKTRKAAY
jgi:hypothetical protein